MSYYILLGVVSGVLSACFVWLFSTFRSEAFLPWYQRLVYRGVLVDGTWKGERRDGDALYGFNIKLEQNGHIVTGTFTAENERPGGHTTKSFRLNGEITDSCVLLSYSPCDHHTYGSGAFLFQVSHGGDTLRGGMLFFRTTDLTVGGVSDINLKRAPFA